MSLGAAINVRIAQLVLCACVALALTVFHLILARRTGCLPTRLSEQVQVIVPIMALLSFTLWSYARDRSLKRLIAFTLISILTLSGSDDGRDFSAVLTIFYKKIGPAFELINRLDGDLQKFLRISPPLLFPTYPYVIPVP